MIQKILFITVQQFTISVSFTGWVKKGDEEPGEEITEISELPDDFDMKSEVLSEDQCYKITLQIMYI